MAVQGLLGIGALLTRLRSIFTLITSWRAFGVAYLVAQFGKKFVFVAAFVGLIFLFMACMKLIITPLLAPLSALAGPLFTGLSYIVPPIFDLAISAMLSARICVWVFLQHYVILKMVADS